MNHRLSMLGAAALACAVPPAMAQQDDPAPADVLRGPTVQERDVPGVTPSMAMRERTPFQLGERPIRPRQFVRAVESLASDDVDPSLRPTDEQAARFREIVDEMNRARRDYLRENRDTIREARTTLGDAFGRLREGPRQEVLASLSEEQRAAAATIKEVMDNTPRPDDHYVEIWSMLSEAQQAHVEAQLAEVRDDRDPAMRDGERAQPRTPLTIDDATARLEALPPAQRRYVLQELASLLEVAERSAERQEAPDLDDDELRAMLER